MHALSRKQRVRAPRVQPLPQSTPPTKTAVYAACEKPKPKVPVAEYARCARGSRRAHVSAAQHPAAALAAAKAGSALACNRSASTLSAGDAPHEWLKKISSCTHGSDSSNGSNRR